uniref:Uncharacterized protein n=1 Tax=viral metagenome TaxID=1070528 RepID=A0A6C0EB74_9ZZZZ
MTDIPAPEFNLIIDEYIRQKTLKKFLAKEYECSLSECFQKAGFFNRALENIINEINVSRYENGIYYKFYKMDNSNNLVSADRIWIEVKKTKLLEMYNDKQTPINIKIAIHLFMERNKFLSETMHFNAKICLNDMFDSLKVLRVIMRHDVDFTYSHEKAYIKDLNYDGSENVYIQVKKSQA